MLADNILKYSQKKKFDILFKAIFCLKYQILSSVEIK